jgi:hypothetical protein
MPFQRGAFWDELCGIQGELRRRPPLRNLKAAWRLARHPAKADIGYERDQISRGIAGLNLRRTAQRMDDAG